MKNHPLPNIQREKEFEMGHSLGRERKGLSMVRSERDGSGSAGVLWVPLLVLMAERDRSCRRKSYLRGFTQTSWFLLRPKSAKSFKHQTWISKFENLGMLFQRITYFFEFWDYKPTHSGSSHVSLDYLLHFYWVVSKVSNLLKIRPPQETTI